MRSAMLTVRIEPTVMKRLDQLAKSTGRSRSFLAAEAIALYLDVNKWEVGGIRSAISSLDRGEGIPHHRVARWVASWGSVSEKPMPKRS